MTEKNGDLKYKTDNAIDEAYRRGFTDGAMQGGADRHEQREKTLEALMSEYKRGYEDAKKEFIGMSAKQIQIKYHDDFATALEKMYEYEERQKEEIKVGDEVYDKYNPYPRVVTSINKQDMADLIDARGNAHSDSVFCLNKTGRHFPQIAEVLEQMRKESHETD